MKIPARKVRIIKLKPHATGNVNTVCQRIRWVKQGRLGVAKKWCPTQEIRIHSGKFPDRTLRAAKAPERVHLRDNVPDTRIWLVRYCVIESGPRREMQNDFMGKTHFSGQRFAINRKRDRCKYRQQTFPKGPIHFRLLEARIS
jgi:hypothetical protein